MATMEELKAEVERLGLENGHRPGPWLEVGPAGQLGCLTCDRYAFVQALPEPGRIHAEAFEVPCADRGRLLRFETPESG
ncbi:MAG: hypothetical protein ACRDHM_03270 [Actinomycetota bacterium]